MTRPILHAILLQFVKAVCSGDFQTCNSFDWTIDVFSEPLQLRKIACHSYQNHAQFKRDVQSAYVEGKFRVQKTNRKFSKIGLDHNHKRLNGKIKYAGGAIELTENNGSLQRWLVVGPNTAHLIDESEYSIRFYQLENDVQEDHDSNETS